MLLVSAKAPTAVLVLPASLLTIEAVPTAVFSTPAVLSKSAAAPAAVFESPLLVTRVPVPTPVLKLPVLVPNNANQPSPVFRPRWRGSEARCILPPLRNWGSNRPAEESALACAVKTQGSQASVILL